MRMCETGELIENDRWGGEFEVEELGRYVYTITGWVDAYGTWAATGALALPGCFTS